MYRVMIAICAWLFMAYGVYEFIMCGDVYDLLMQFSIGSVMMVFLEVRLVLEGIYDKLDEKGAEKDD